jgi:anti-sigma factor RsiW
MNEDIQRCSDLEERLASYVDGEATPEARHAVDLHLAACPPCRRRAEAEAGARAVVHEHRAGLKAHAPESLRDRCTELAYQQPSASTGSQPSPSIGTRESAFQPSIANRKSAIRRWMPLSLAATLLLAVGGVFLFGLNDRVDALAASLAIDHVKCFKTLKTGPDAPADPVAAASLWKQDQGWPITVPRTEPSEQLQLLAVRRCFSTEGRAVHLMYDWRGAPLSVYVLQENAGQDRVCEHMGREAVIWCANGRTYAVVADGRPQDLSHIVDYIKTRVE